MQWIQNKAGKKWRVYGTNKKNSNTEQYIASETCGTPSSMPPYTYCKFQKEKREKREQKKVFKDINGWKLSKFNLKKKKNLHIDEARQTPSMKNFTYKMDPYLDTL